MIKMVIMKLVPNTIFRYNVHALLVEGSFKKKFSENQALLSLLCMTGADSASVSSGRVFILLDIFAIGIPELLMVLPGIESEFEAHFCTE